jgi:hypothetical protein
MIKFRYNKGMVILGFFYIILAVGLAYSLFHNTGYLTDLALGLYSANGVGLLMLLLALVYVGIRIIRKKKISSIKRQLVGFLFYLSVLGTLQSIGISTGLIGLFLVSMVKGYGVMLFIPAVLMIFVKLMFMYTDDPIAEKIERESRNGWRTKRVEPVLQHTKKIDHEIKSIANRIRKTRSYEKTDEKPASIKPTQTKEYILPPVSLMED